MLSVDNGFTRFMSKLEGRSTPEVKSKWSTRELLEVEILGYGHLLYAIEGHHTHLIDAFVWRTAPQGHVYWASRNDGENLMNEDDYLFLKALFKAHCE